MSANAANDHSATEVHDGVINHIFGAGLTLAAILSLQRVDAEVAERLRHVLDTLDAAVVELRTATFARFVADSNPQPETTHAVNLDGYRRLSRFAVDELFAYAIGSYDFYRAADHTLWARESDGLLLCAQSGKPLARRDGKVFYDIESDSPLYYEEPHAVPLPDQLSEGSL